MFTYNNHRQSQCLTSFIIISKIRRQSRESRKNLREFLAGYNFEGNGFLLLLTSYSWSLAEYYFSKEEHDMKEKESLLH